ncbi:MAG: 50S ribosomal protein L32 [Bacilli bacterium]|nr:50S ribosomal protein L32 [Bacilli bacterium]
MAVPKRRTSKTKKRKRRTNIKYYGESTLKHNLVTCSNCNEIIMAHIVCPKCGFYKGEKIL